MSQKGLEKIVEFIYECKNLDEEQCEKLPNFGKFKVYKDDTWVYVDYEGSDENGFDDVFYRFKINNFDEFDGLGELDIEDFKEYWDELGI